jgi:hypothetical protein
LDYIQLKAQLAMVTVLALVLMSLTMSVLASLILSVLD